MASARVNMASIEFRIADTFTDSLARLTGDEQKAAKTTAFDLQINPAHPGLQFHKLDRAKDKNFWSVRVSTDIRLIVHKTECSLLLCYVDHHDKAYDWAERRKLETHPKTGAAQLVEIRETVKEIAIPQVRRRRAARLPAAEATALRPSARRRAAELRRAGGMAAGRTAGDGRTAPGVGRSSAGRGRRGAARTGDRWQAASAKAGRPVGVDPFAHPDAQRRFRVMDDRRGTGTGARLPVGKVDGLPASRPGTAGGDRLHRPGASVRFGGHRQDHRRPAPRRASGARQPGCPRPADDVLRHAGAMRSRRS